MLLDDRPLFHLARMLVPVFCTAGIRAKPPGLKAHLGYWLATLRAEGSSVLGGHVLNRVFVAIRFDGAYGNVYLLRDFFEPNPGSPHLLYLYFL